ncbi:DUF707 domain-containing protein [Amphritea balenae]|uniref:DUF707 domain-containing protein n=1 Tax=Amphritea balenae TaxID=452629 RepID=UPI0014752529|nr:DUF707 domain-containing protein [Amphritea balenae]GGK58224.1 hypothetical protein GCM10007941_05410 [Amphritea balenae]
MEKKGLVLVRTGCDHHIQNWLTHPRNLRSWDLAISRYQDIAFPDKHHIDYLHYFKGGKWDGIFNFFSDNPTLIEKYEYFWLVDDDIECDVLHIDKLFSYVAKNKFELSQPALTLDSYYSHKLTLQCPGFRHRHVSMVEIMAPILSKEQLKKSLPYFENTKSGCGIDWLWHKFVTEKYKKISIIDELAVCHSRPLGQHLKKEMKKVGKSSVREREQLMSECSFGRHHMIVYSGVLSSGKKIRNRFSASFYVLFFYLKNRKLFLNGEFSFYDYMKIIYNQFFCKIYW